MADAVVNWAAVEVILHVAAAHNRRVLVTRGSTFKVVISLILLAKPSSRAEPRHILRLIVRNGCLSIRSDLRRAIVVTFRLFLVA